MNFHKPLSNGIYQLYITPAKNGINLNITMSSRLLIEDHPILITKGGRQWPSQSVPEKCLNRTLYIC